VRARRGLRSRGSQRRSSGSDPSRDSRNESRCFLFGRETLEAAGRSRAAVAARVSAAQSYRTFPRAATFQLPSTRPPRPYQISSCRFTVAHTWLGTTQTFSPTRAVAPSRDSPFVRG